MAELAVWEPCNTVSNLAYDRLVVEMCSQTNWSFPPDMVTTIAESFALVTQASALYHGSETKLGSFMDGRSNDLMSYVIHQAAVSSLPYTPVIHDLAEESRPRTGKQVGHADVGGVAWYCRL